MATYASVHQPLSKSLFPYIRSLKVTQNGKNFKIHISKLFSSILLHPGQDCILTFTYMIIIQWKTVSFNFFPFTFIMIKILQTFIL